MTAYDTAADKIFKAGDARTFARAIAVATIIAHDEIVASLLEHSDTVREGRAGEHMKSIIGLFERHMLEPQPRATSGVLRVRTLHDSATVTAELKKFVVIMLGGAYLEAGLTHHRMSMSAAVGAEYMKRLRSFARLFEAPMNDMPTTVRELTRAFSAEQGRIPTITTGLRDLALAVLKSDSFLREASESNPVTLLNSINSHIDAKIVQAL
ncbi:MAG TPA: hypothetical protein VFZ48_05965 [Candidatus Saccharimonadales bacterium]